MMLEQLFGSRTRIKLLKIFLAQPHQQFFVRELTRMIGERINSVRRELQNLERLGVVIQEHVQESAPSEGSAGSKKRKKQSRRKRSQEKKKYYRANPEFVLFEELKSLVVKSQLLVGRTLTEAMSRLGKVSMLLLMGFFVGDPEADTDLFVVGSIDRKKFMKLLKQVERSFGHQINFTLMTVREFKARKAMTDKFLYKVLEGKKMTLVDETNP